MRRAARVVIACALLLAAAGCGGSQREEPAALSLGDSLGTTPAACGLGRQPVDLEELTELKSVEEQLAGVRAAVERLRGLESKDPLRPTLVSQSELARRIADQYEQEFSPAEADHVQQALRLLGAVPAGFDLRDELVDAVGETVGGYYDPDTKRLFVARSGTGPLEEEALEGVAHELEHALSDAVLGLPQEQEDDWGDADLAEAALVEGSATAVELRFLLALLDPFTGAFLFEVPVEEAFDSGLPHYLERGLAFPYVEGLGFVCHLYARGGWDAVNRAFDRPPASSAEILFPERYDRRVQPTRPQPLGTPGEEWRRLDDLSGVFGAADLVALFEAPGDDRSRALERPLERAAAWGGGKVDSWWRAGRAALGISLAERAPRGHLCESMLEWYGRAFPDAARSGDEGRAVFSAPEQSAAVHCRGGDVVLGIAPELATARRIARLD
jgi:hypothetical protein